MGGTKDHGLGRRGELDERIDKSSTDGAEDAGNVGSVCNLSFLKYY